MFAVGKIEDRNSTQVVQIWLPPKRYKDQPCLYAVRRWPSASWTDCGEVATFRVGNDWYCQPHGQALLLAEGR